MYFLKQTHIVLQIAGGPLSTCIPRIFEGHLSTQAHTFPLLGSLIITFSILFYMIIKWNIKSDSKHTQSL